MSGHIPGSVKTGALPGQLPLPLKTHRAKPPQKAPERRRLEAWQKSGMSPTARSLSFLRAHGYHAEVVERWIPQARVRKDLFGFVDILALPLSGDGPVLAVQTTSGSCVSARLKKITESPLLPQVQKGFTVVIHGWRRLKSGWAPKEVIL